MMINVRLMMINVYINRLLIINASAQKFSNSLIRDRKKYRDRKNIWKKGKKKKWDKSGAKSKETITFALSYRQEIESACKASINCT